MESLRKGKFYGLSSEEIYINGLTVVDSNYHNYDNCPWHFHRNAHFAFTTKGNLVENHKKGQIILSPGCLVYNHCQEPHCNADYSAFVSALHIDIDESWFKKLDLNHTQIEGVHVLQNPILKILFSKIQMEVKNYDNLSALTIESIAVQAVSEMLWETRANALPKPVWVNKIKDLLYSGIDMRLTLEKIALEINIHPVYLCQQFPTYFHSTFGNYIRKIRIEKAIGLMLNKPRISLTQIAYECGFSDQSHFIRLFKKNVGVTPLAYRKSLL